MVLYKRKAVSLVPATYVPEEDDQPVWHIPETQEYFCTYDEYLERLDFYLQPKFICELSGASCLTYFAAREREITDTKNVLRVFPEPLKQPILERVHCSSTTRLDQLVDDIYNAIKDQFFIGETVSVRFEEQKVKAVVVKATDGVYQVDDGRRVLEGDSSQLIRDRKLVSKLTLRAFIKHSATRKPTATAPWVVKPEYACKYSLAAQEPSAAPPASQFSVIAPRSNHMYSAVSDRPLRLAALEARLTPEFRSDDLFMFALLEIPLEKAIEKHCTKFPRPQWHIDERLNVFGNDIAHVFEVWLFSQFFTELLDTPVATFDEFLEALNTPEPSELLFKLHTGVFSLLVKEGGTKLAIELNSDEDSEKAEKPNRRGKDWIARIGERKYTRGGWKSILFAALVALKCDVEAETYPELSSTDRVRALVCLTRATYATDTLRDFLDAQYELASKLRRKPLVKELKQVRDEQRNVQRLLQLRKDPDSSGGLLAQQLRSLSEELGLANKSTEELVEHAEMLEQQASEKNTELLKTQQTIARLDNQRMRMLGKDRFFNRYWWMDSSGVSQDESYAMGRLCVQGPASYDAEFLFGDDYKHEFVQYRQMVLEEYERMRQEKPDKQRIKLRARQKLMPKREKDTRRFKPIAPRPSESADESMTDEIIVKEGAELDETQVAAVERRIQSLVAAKARSTLQPDESSELAKLEELMENRSEPPVPPQSSQQTIMQVQMGVTQPQPQPQRISGYQPQSAPQPQVAQPQMIPQMVMPGQPMMQPISGQQPYLPQPEMQWMLQQTPQGPMMVCVPVQYQFPPEYQAYMQQMQYMQYMQQLPYHFYPGQPMGQPQIPGFMQVPQVVSTPSHIATPQPQSVKSTPAPVQPLQPAQEPVTEPVKPEPVQHEVKPEAEEEEKEEAMVEEKKTEEKTAKDVKVQPLEEKVKEVVSEAEEETKLEAKAEMKPEVEDDFEVVSVTERLQKRSAEDMKNAKPDVMTPREIYDKFEGNEPILGPNEWRFYDSPREIEALLQYLFTTGNREPKLAAALRKNQHSIYKNMVARLKALDIGGDEEILQVEELDIRASTEPTETSSFICIY